MLGVAHADEGNVSEALLHYSHALELAGQLDDKSGMAVVLQNLGVALNYAGLYNEAIPCLTHAAQIAHSSEEARHCLNGIHTNLAQSYFHTERFQLAREQLDSCPSTKSEPSNATEALQRTIREFTYVQVAVELQLGDVAKTHAKRCKQYAAWGATPRSVLLGDFASGLCEFFVGNAPEGLSQLENCARRSENVPSARSFTLLGLVRALDSMGNADRALATLHELQAHIKTTRQNSVARLFSMMIALGEDLNLDEIDKNLTSISNREYRLRAQAAESALASSQLEMLERMAIVADLREEASGEHGFRVGKLSMLFAVHLGMSEEDSFSVEIAARLHDIGKVGVPDRILLSSAELKAAERQLMTAHTQIGAELLGKSTFPQVRTAEEVARCHHEWWNGNGYPNRISGRRIPLSARIVALADVFDAITHGRPYATPWPVDRALEQIRSLRGQQFDPELTDAFVDFVTGLAERNPKLDAYLGGAGRRSPFLQARQRIRQMTDAHRDDSLSQVVH